MHYRGCAESNTSWAHTRREFVDACEAEPVLAEMALEKIGRLYRVEAQLREARLAGEEKRRYRGENAMPIVDDFFQWLGRTFTQQVLLASNRFAKAASYALHREQALRVFLDHPEVEIDTNKDERALRPIPMGRKNWLFCSTELGGRYVGIAQTLIKSCRLQGVDPWIYLIDVLQRIDTHPAFEVHLLTPRLWKENFADNPMLSECGTIAKMLLTKRGTMGSIIEINDTLQLTTEQGFPADLDLDRHLKTPFQAAEFEGRVFEFKDKGGIRVYKALPVRNFLVQNIDGKWLYWGLFHILQITHDYEKRTTSGRFKLIHVYSPLQMRQAHDLVDRNTNTRFFDLD